MSFSFEEFSKIVIQNTTYLFGCIGSDGHLKCVNPPWQKILGYTEEELQSKPFIQFVHPSDQVLIQEMIRKGSEQIGNVEFKSWMVTKTGASLWFIWNIIYTDEKFVFISGHDITKSVLAQISPAEFVSVVSHELRTPLTSIKGALGLILGSEASLDPGVHKKFLEIAYRNSERLGALINGIFDIEKIEDGSIPFKIKSFDLINLIKNEIEMHRPFALQNKISLVFDPPQLPLNARVDEEHFLQLVTNLLSNAIKFSPEGGKVVVMAEKTDDKIRISVKDNGIGIPDEFRSRVFQKFSQRELGSKRQQGGIGLGLSISKLIVDRLGGTIDFKSEEGKGTTFFFELPYDGSE